MTVMKTELLVWLNKYKETQISERKKARYKEKQADRQGQKCPRREELSRMAMRKLKGEGWWRAGGTNKEQELRKESCNSSLDAHASLIPLLIKPREA